MILVLTVHVGTDKVDVGLSARAIDVEVFEIAAHFGSHRGVGIGIRLAGAYG